MSQDAHIDLIRNRLPQDLSDADAAALRAAMQTDPKITKAL